MYKELLMRESNNRFSILNKLLRLCEINDYQRIEFNKIGRNGFWALFEINGKYVVITTKMISTRSLYFRDSSSCDAVVHLTTMGIGIQFVNRKQKNINLRIDPKNNAQIEKHANQILKILTNIDSSGVCLAMISLDRLPRAQQPVRMATHSRKLRLRNEIRNKRNINFFQEKESDIDCALIDLFFGTNRNIQENTDLNKTFGTELSELSLGVCKVLIPKKENHIEGDIERPIRFLNIEFPEIVGKHFIIKELNISEKHDFVEMLSKDIESDQKSALIFIHGYNTTFSEAAYRTAQIVYDLPYSGIGCFFSWPSIGKTKDYLLDEVNANSSITKLENFIRLFLTETKVEKLHLIAHSMGNRVLSFTLKNLAEDVSIRDKLRTIEQIIFGAPDISQDEFKSELLPKIKLIEARKTLYASDKDKALNISQFLRSKNPRLGQAGESLFLSEGIETIDATNVPSNTNGHSYIFDTKELLTDLFLLIKNNFNPIDRRLQEINMNELRYWLFPQQK